MARTGATALILLVFAGTLLASGWGHVGTDISALYLGGWLVARDMGEVLYAGAPALVGEAVAPAWVAGGIEAGLSPAGVVGFVYPPLWAWLVAPLTGALSPAAFANVASGLGLLGYGLSVVAAWRLARPPLPLPVFTGAVLVASLASLPLLFAWALVQPQLLVIAAILWSVERAARERETAAGLLLGLAAAVKVSPVLFILLFVAERRWRAAALTLLTAGALALLSLATMGWAAHLEFLEAAGLFRRHTLLFGGNVTFGTAAHALLVPETLETFPPANAFIPTVPGLAALSGVLGLALSAGTLWASRGLPDAVRPALRLALLYPVLTFFAPLAWSHYYAPVPVLIVALYGRVARGPWALASLAAAAMVFAPLGSLLAERGTGTPLSALQLHMTLCLIFAWAALAFSLRRPV
ncbi:MAG: glycosyltransferase family 87 protein [Pseudomonadota bacterium]